MYFSPALGKCIGGVQNGTRKVTTTLIYSTMILPSEYIFGMQKRDLYIVLGALFQLIWIDGSLKTRAVSHLD